MRCRAHDWILLLALLTALGGTGCRTLVPVPALLDVPFQDVPEGATREQIDEAIWRAGRKLGWVVEASGPESLRGTLHIRRHVAVVSITHDMRSFSIRYADSHNLGYDGHDIHPNYAVWVERLAAKIQQEPIAP